nr:LacI family DNA-binding transcriptional regulator [Bifidobacterium breve]
MGNRVTIKDVAQLAGVSMKTVSNVVNNTGRMRPQTRERVEHAMQQLGYTVNLSARAIRSGGTKLIGLNIFDFSQPFASYLTDKVIEFAKHAVDMLIERIEGYSGPARTYTTDFTVVERASTKLAR